MSLLTDLISAWELNEASGNALDSHGSNTLTETSGTIGASSGPGGSGGSRDFELGDTEYFTVASNSSLQMGDIDFTIECWASFESLSAANQDCLGKAGQTTLEYVVGYGNSANRLRFFVLDFATGTVATTVTANNFGAPSTGTWYQIVCQHDAAANQISIRVNDGTPNTASHSSGVYSGSNALLLGARGTTTPSIHFDGLLSKVRIWKRLLTSGEITSLYNSGNGLDYSSFGGSTFTASAAVTTGATTASGSGTFSPPVYSGSAALTTSESTVSGAATFAPPQYSASAAVTTGPASTSASGTFSPPVYAGSAAVITGPASITGSGAFASAIYSGSASPSAAPATLSGAGTFTAPVYSGSSAPSTGELTCSGVGTFSFAADHSGTADLVTASLQCSGAGTFTPRTQTTTTRSPRRRTIERRDPMTLHRPRSPGVRFFGGQR